MRHLGAPCCCCSLGRSSAVGQDSLGSGRKELVQVLLRKRMINGDGGVKGVGAPLSSTAPLLGLGVILVPLCSTWDHVGLSGDDDSRFSLCSLQPEITCWFCSFQVFSHSWLKILVSPRNLSGKSVLCLTLPCPFWWALHQLLSFVCRGQGSAG